jgi:hypothetical protein
MNDMAFSTLSSSCLSLLSYAAVNSKILVQILVAIAFITFLFYKCSSEDTSSTSGKLTKGRTRTLSNSITVINQSPETRPIPNLWPLLPAKHQSLYQESPSRNPQKTE